VGVPRKLTERQIIFVRELIHNEGRITATEAAIRAGYPKNSASMQASRLQSPAYSPLVVEHIKAVRAEEQKKYDVTREKHFKKLQEIGEKALEEGSYSAAVNAEVARGKAGGLYVNQNVTLSGNIKDLTQDQIKDEIKEMINKIKTIRGEATEVKEPKKIVSSKDQSTKGSPKKRSKAN
jgi:phage terminase small subunit